MINLHNKQGLPHFTAEQYPHTLWQHPRSSWTARTARPFLRVSNNAVFCFLSNHLNKNAVYCIICWSYFSSWNMNYESFWNTSAKSSCNMAWLYSLHRSPQLIAFWCKSCFCFIKLTFPFFFPLHGMYLISLHWAEHFLSYQVDFIWG